MKRIAIFFAEGYEEIEALTVVDMCRRAGIQIDMVSVTKDMEVTGAHGIKVTMDANLTTYDPQDVDMIVLPGGMPGTLNLEKSAKLMCNVDVFAQCGKYVAAICAAPSILGHNGLLKGKRACCYPGFEEELTGATVTYNPCEVDGNIITARGMGCAIAFSKEIIRVFMGDEKAEEIVEKIIY